MHDPFGGGVKGSCIYDRTVCMCLLRARGCTPRPEDVIGVFFKGMKPVSNLSTGTRRAHLGDRDAEVSEELTEGASDGDDDKEDVLPLIRRD